MGSLLIGFVTNWVHYLGPPGPFSFPDSRDILEVLGGLSLAEGEGRVPRGSSRTLGDPPLGALSIISLFQMNNEEGTHTQLLGTYASISNITSISVDITSILLAY